MYSMRNRSDKEKHCFICKIQNRLSRILLDSIRRHVYPESIIHTDPWKGNKSLKREGVTHYKEKFQSLVDPV